MRLAPGEDDRRYIRRLALTVLAGAVVLFLYFISDLLLLAFGALLGAVLLTTVADSIVHHTRLPRTAGLTIAAAMLFGVLGLIGWLFGAQLADEMNRLLKALPDHWARVEARIGAHPVGSLFIDSARKAFDGGVAARLLGGFGIGAGEVLVNFIIILVGTLFFASNPALYRRGLVMLAPPFYRAVVDDAAGDVGQALRLWLLSQLISMLLMGIMIAAGLWWAGLDSWAALGVLGGLAEFIPYVGPLLAMIPAIVVAVAGDGSVTATLATYAVVRLVQVNLLTPLISQRVVDVPAALYLFGIIATGFAFGSFGLFFSGALVVTGFTLVRRLYLHETLGDPIPPPGEAHYDEKNEETRPTC